MTVDDFASVLSGSDLEFVEDGEYYNTLRRKGYWAIYKNSNGYFKFSISSCDERFAPEEVAAAIANSRRVIMREKPYFNSWGQQGLEATVKSGNHSFMLTAAPDIEIF
jgi:hypothetical protein